MTATLGRSLTCVIEIGKSWNRLGTVVEDGAVSHPAEHQARRDDAEARLLENELLLLRKYRGFTPTRLAKAPVLQHILGGADETFEMHQERFISAIHSLRDPEPELLLAVYGLMPETVCMASLDARRKYVGSQVVRSVATVADWETPAIDHLRSQLITGWYPKSPLAVRLPTSHNGVIQEAVSIRTVVKDRRWQETREFYRLFAAFDEADYFTISSSFPGRPEPEGDFTVRTKRIGVSFSHQFWHKDPMRRGRFYDLRFRLVPDPAFGDPGVLTEESRAFHEPTRYAGFEVLFVGEKPARTWWYERLSYFERPGVPTQSQLLEIDRVASVLTRFHDLYGGLHHGIAWEWAKSK